MIIVSACLVGINCRYDGGNNANQKVIELVNKGFAIPVCPEQLGGLPTPRIPAEIIRNKVINKNDEDITDYFKKGARETLQISKLANCREAILKQNSPSCGYGKIYDGTHTGKIIAGKGITAKLLEDNGIKVIAEEDL